MNQSPQIISDLVKKFERNLDEYRNPKYNETQIRVEFVNPFWKALGWDVDNEKGYSLNYRDVIHEDELKVGRTTRAPDYAFRIGGRRIFFLETKKPALDLKHDSAPAFQLRRYAYSAKLPVSLLTDFEELIVYDCRLKPAITDKPHIGRMTYFTYQEYLKKWDEISRIFSKEAVMQGAFDRFIEDTQGKRPRAEIDRDFLNDLDKWRIELARNIALRNPQLTERELNYAVQLTIDRLIFLRMCEDRDIEQYEALMSLLNGAQIYQRLVALYYKADERYNSGLFHFEEKDGANPDVLTPRLEVDDKILKEIISELYYPKCPYEFSVLPVEVLGNAYEQFLGKRITLTEGHRARIEEKPEVRKAGGVYYTPQYIVDYIVKNTVGKLCEGKTPREVSELRILDPACGSGSFLLGAYQHLLDWHVEWYRSEMKRTGEVPQSAERSAHSESRERDRQRKAKSQKRAAKVQAIFQGKGGDWYLTTAEKKRILLDNIYGVDIDANAVEVTKLSLLLKVLENETSETLNQQLGLWKERALPNLDSNIKCGNSLIGTDFYEGRQAGLFNEDEALRINAFDWQREFPEIFAKGGFDAVIGNPPYISVEMMSKDISEFYIKSYSTAYGRANSFSLFIEKIISITKENGCIGLITSNRILTNTQLYKLREIILQNCTINDILSFKKSVFKAAVDTTVFTLSKQLAKDDSTINIKYDIENFHENGYLDNKIHQLVYLKNPNFIFNIKQKENLLKIIEKIMQASILLKEICDVKDGIILGSIKDLFLANSKRDIRYEKWLEGKEVSRYLINWTGRYLCYDNRLIGEELKRKKFKAKEKAISDLDFKKLSRSGIWLRNPKIYRQLKILTRQNAKKIIGVLDNDQYFVKNSLHSIISKGLRYDLRYVLGILNSRLMDFYFKNKIGSTGEIFSQMKIAYIEGLPIKIIDLSIGDEVKSHNALVFLVDNIHELYKKHFSAKDPRTRELMQRQIAATDRQIDQLVYQLYGLTEEEIRIVEGNL